MQYKLAIFDFDGTLADSFPFFTSVFNRLAQRHGFRSVAPEEVSQLRRLNARQIMTHLGMPAWKLPIVATNFISLMSDAASVPLFEGVSELLGHLADEEVVLAIVSSNSYENVERVLGPENMRRVSYFECGVSIFGKRSRIRKVLKNSGIRPGEAIYIGDQSTDLEAARAEKVAFGAVSWGYGDVEALRSLAPDELFTRADDIRSIAGAPR